MKKLRNALVALLIAVSIFLGVRKVDELSADPLGEKDCPPLGPESMHNTSQTSVMLDVLAEALPWAQQGGTINDASCLNRTPVHGVVRVATVDDIQNALRYASEHNLKVSMAGVRHSMGGQAFYTGALVLDITAFNKMTLDAENQVLTVQSGATWHEIQEFLHPHYAIKAMQSTDIFTVGGSISVNAHGMDHQVGALGKTIRAMNVMLADGSIQRVSRTQNPELFSLVVGGYGLFGVILDVELEVTENVIYESERRILDYDEFPPLFADEIGLNPRIGLMYGHLSTAPQSFLREMLLYTYEEQEIAPDAVPDEAIPPLGSVSNERLRRFVLNFSKLGDIPMRIKWFAEKRVEPLIESCSISRDVLSRNQAMKEGEACLVTRNEPMHDSVRYLKNNLQGETDILHEYFIPRAEFVSFVDGLRAIMLANDANLLNASVRVVHAEDNFLNYAPTDMFSIVLYVNQPTTAEGNAHMRRVTQELVDLAISLDGTFFLPYQLYFTPEQLHAAYPNIDEFFTAKEKYDPAGLFTNTFYEKYAP